MKILFITASRIGDAVLSSGVLSHIERSYPEAQVTVACGPLAVSLFEGCPFVETVIPLQKRSYHRHWIDLWRASIGTHWDWVIDLRNSAVSRLVRAKKRSIFGPHIDKTQHKVLQNAAVIGVTPAPEPKLWFTDAQQEKALALMGNAQGRKTIGVGPAANWQGKTWPAERFIEILSGLVGKGGAYQGARIAVFGAPGEEDVCQQVLSAFPAADTLDLIAKGSPGEAAAMIAQCDFYLGNDSGLMHAAAACGVKTFGLFGPSYPHLYSPWGQHCAYARTPESFDELIDYEGYTPQSAPCLMGSLSTDMVRQSLEGFLQS
ncbi:MAG: glycosyltransferase 9 family protein [Alphaproteobacteria bacterium]|nr:glycosyltransferase 9 family protein [Alphaproteobacteria bacterium]|tara:strand:+ start:18975 stop:19928 length:954 start_codon:yes stop_codon:yes gene_type:complete